MWPQDIGDESRVHRNRGGEPRAVGLEAIVSSMPVGATLRPSGRLGKSRVPQ